MIVVIVLLALMLFLISLGVPVAFAMGVSITATLVFILHIPLVVVASHIIDGMNAWIWLTMPLFLMLGNLMNVSGVTEKLISFSRALVGHIPGGLSHIGVLTNVMMAGMSGSSNADAAATGSVMIPAMKKNGYSPGYSAALIGCASLIGPLIPPSMGLIVVAVLMEISVLRLWLGGVVPGFMLGIALMITGYIMARWKGFPRYKRAPIKQMMVTGGVASSALVIPIVILGGMRVGVFTATEAGAVGVVYILLLAFCYKTFKLKKVEEASWASVKLAGPILWIIASALLFAWVIAVSGAGPVLVDFICRFGISPTAFLLVVNALVLGLGFVIEGFPIIMILVPLLAPVASAVGVNPIQFGLLFHYCVSVGQMTPPVGAGHYIVMGIADCHVDEYVREGWPLLLTVFTLVPPLIFFPQLITWVPDLIMGPAG